MVIKEYQDRSSARDSNHDLALLQREARHDTHVLQQLGDQPGIPFLFGVLLEAMGVFKCPEDINIPVEYLIRSSSSRNLGVAIA